MKTLFSTLTTSTLAALVGLAALGCDQPDTDEPTDRGARVVMELDGALVRTWTVDAPDEMRADLATWEAVAPTADTCEDGEVELAVVLEHDGEALASFEGCAPAAAADHAASDALTASPDPQATVWCDQCDLTNDCFACCKCATGKTAYCASVC